MPLSTVSTAGGVIPNASGNDVKIVEGGGAGTLTLAAATTIVNTLQNTATATAVTVDLAGHQLVAGNGAIDSGVGLIAINAGAKSLTIGSSVAGGTVTCGTSGAFTLGLINAGGNSSVLDIKSAIVDNAGGGSVSVITLNTGTVILEGTNTFTGGLTVNSCTLVANAANAATGAAGNGNITVNSGGTISVTGDNALWGWAPGTTHTLQINAGGTVSTTSSSGQPERRRHEWWHAFQPPPPRPTTATGIWTAGASPPSATDPPPPSPAAPWCSPKPAARPSTSSPATP